MATKKEAEVVEDIKEVKEVKAAKAPKASDPWMDMIEIRLPKPLPGEDNYVIASVNGKTFKIKKGVSVSVPAPIAEVLEHSLEAEEAAELYQQGKQG